MPAIPVRNSVKPGEMVISAIVQDGLCLRITGTQRLQFSGTQIVSAFSNGQTSHDDLLWVESLSARSDSNGRSTKILGMMAVSMAEIAEAPMAPEGPPRGMTLFTEILRDRS